jgi:hypothetical protein
VAGGLSPSALRKNRVKMLEFFGAGFCPPTVKTEEAVVVAEHARSHSRPETWCPLSLRSPLFSAPRKIDTCDVLLLH